ncbi:hypothetical protein BDZ97DRAFT_1924145 [Flammula alnicola]|nr:hypothetical protein BDZ97DRAFT_1924145 [Flammula alnicola]
MGQPNTWRIGFQVSQGVRDVAENWKSRKSLANSELPSTNLALHYVAMFDPNPKAFTFAPKIPYKTPRKQQDLEWSFDFHTNLSCYNDSDDSDLDSNPPVSTDSVEAKLLKDMDLSTREEAVTYKPNPFSMQKRMNKRA